MSTCLLVTLLHGAVCVQQRPWETEGDTVQGVYRGGQAVV